MVNKYVSKYTYIVIDIETVPRTIPDEILAWKKKKLEEKYVKPETVASHLADWVDNGWIFQPGGSRPVVVGLFDSISNHAVALCSDDEVELGTMVADYFTRIHEATPMAEMIKLVGFNLLSFDLPQLMATIQKANVEIDPPGKFGRYDIIDLINQPFGYNAGMYSLEYYGHAYGLGHKSGDGKSVLENWKADLADGGSRVKDYCLKDVEITNSLFKMYSRFYRF